MFISSGTVVFLHHAGKVTGRDGMGGSIDGWTGDADGTVRGESLKRGEADMLGAGDSGSRACCYKIALYQEKSLPSSNSSMISYRSSNS